MGSVSTFLSLSLPYLASTKLPFTEPEFYVWAFCAGFNVAMVFAFAVKSVESKFVNKLFEMEAFDSGRAITICQTGIKNSALLRFLLRDKSSLRNVILLANSEMQNEINENDSCENESDVDRNETQNAVTESDSCENESDVDHNETQNAVTESDSCENVSDVDRSETRNETVNEDNNKDVTDADHSDLKVKHGERQKVDFDKAKFYISKQKLDRATSLKKGAIKWYLLPVFCAVSIGLAIGVCYILPIILNW